MLLSLLSEACFCRDAAAEVGGGGRRRRQPITGGALGPGVFNFLLRNAQVGTMPEASNAAQPNNERGHTAMLCR